METQESGPISTGIWDTRSRENSSWCDRCKKWLRLSTFSWIAPEQRLQYHKDEYCGKNT